MKRSLGALFLLLAMISLGLLTGCNSMDLTGKSAYQFKSSELEKYVIIYHESNADLTF